MELNSTSIQATAYNQLYALYPQLAEEANEAWTDILNRSQLVECPENIMLATAGSTITGFMVLLDGTVRVHQKTDDAREITLYRINPGDVCLMSMNSLLHDKPFKANATSETPAKMLMISAADFHEAMDASRAFRNLILSNLVDSMCLMAQSLYDTAFEPLDTRLACLLGRLFERSGSQPINVTHQKLSNELGTSREVISRLLKKLEQQGCISLKRGQIVIGDNREMLGTQPE